MDCGLLSTVEPPTYSESHVGPPQRRPVAMNFCVCPPTVSATEAVTVPSASLLMTPCPNEAVSSRPVAERSTRT